MIARAMITLPTSRLIAMTLGLALAACGGDQKPAGPDAKSPDSSKTAAKTDAKPEVKPDAKTPDAKVKVVDGPGDDRFALRIEAPPDAAVGREGTVKIAAIPQGPWHINLDFPTKLALTAPKDVTLAKAEFAKADAAISDKSAEFAVKFTPTAAGDKEFSGEFKFAVCQDEACSPVTEKVAFKVAVK